MKHQKKSIKLIIIFTVIVLISSILIACGNKTVNALDYSLEDELYDGQQTEQPATPIPAATEGTDDSAEETEAADGTPASEANTPAADAETTIEPEETDSTEETPCPEPTPTPKTSQTETPDSTATLQPDDEDGEPASEFRYTLIVADSEDERLQNVRIALYMDDSLLYTAMSDTDGVVVWTLPSGHTFAADAELEGYEVQKNDSELANAQTDTQVTIVMCEHEDEEDTESSPTITPEPAPTPIPVPTSEPGTVTITVENVDVEAGDKTFTLLDGVAAESESGESISVWVVSDGGFSIDTSGEYTVSYGAMQGESMVTVTRIVTVRGESSEQDEGSSASAPTGSSKERYEVLIAYRNEIYDELTALMEDLESQLAEEVEELTKGKTDVRIMKQIAPEETSEENSLEAISFTQAHEVSVSNWSDILATFIAESSIDVNDPLDLLNLRMISLDDLEDVFWDMNQAGIVQTDDGTDILLYSKSYEDMADEYDMSDQRRDLLYEMMQPEFQRTFASLTGNQAFENATDTEIAEALANLPDGLEVERKTVVETAYSLVGKITYLYGGKFNGIGWNPRWGLPQSVQTTNEDGDTVMVSKICGLDCSGYVSWVFINAIGDSSVIDAIGNGTTSQWSHSESIGWDEGRPGDLAFYAAPGEKEYNHVGVIVSVDDDGSYLVAHCSSREDGVVVTDAWSTGFRYLRRPYLYDD